MNSEEYWNSMQKELPEAYPEEGTNGNVPTPEADRVAS